MRLQSCLKYKIHGEARKMRTLVTMSLPLGQQKRQDRELELAKLLATGRQIAGAIVFSSKYDMFEFLRSSGDTEVPLDMQIPELRLHDRELGPSVRCKTFSLHYMKSDIGYYVRLFVRVIVGKTDLCASDEAAALDAV